MSKSNKYLSEKVKQLLLDPQFLMWCYAPTEDLELRWQSWIKQHPEQEQDLLAARAILSSVKFNNISLPDEESKELFSRIEYNVSHLHKKQLYQKILYRVAAACIALLLVAGTFLYNYNNNRNINQWETLFATDIFSDIDSTQTEIELTLADRNKIVMVNNTQIKFNATGDWEIDKPEIKIVPEIAFDQDVSVAMNTLKVPRGRRSFITLSDGTNVWVNSETILHFPDRFDKDNRTIYADGEIYLEVTKDASRPFHVKTSEMDVQVLGTAFNVTTYADEPCQSVVLAQGRISVTTADGVQQQMKPNERLMLKNDNLEISQVDVLNYIAWKDGLFLFDNQNIAYVARHLSRYYRINIVCTPDIENYTCSGTLVLFDDYTKVLHTLKESLPIAYEINQNTIKLSTNFKK